MATIEKRERQKGTVYQVDIRVSGYPRQKKTFRRLTDAKTWAAKTESEIKSGQFRPLNRNSQRKTFSDVLDRYQGEVLPHLAESTQRAAQTYLKHWRRTLGEYGLSYITAEQISKLMNELAKIPDQRSSAKAAKPKSRKTLKHYRDTLEVLFKKAVSWGWLGINPMDGVEPITKIRNERVRFLSDIDLERHMAILRDTKNGETRSVPIVGYLSELLKEQIGLSNDMYDQLLPSVNQRYLFPRRDLRAPIDIRKAWENALVKANISDFRFHDLRHSTASYLAMQGATLLEIADMLGHKTLQMVKRYSHLSADHKRGLAERLNQEIF